MKNKTQWLKILTAYKPRKGETIGLLRIENNLLSEISPEYGESIPLPMTKEDIESLFTTQFHEETTEKEALEIISTWLKEMQKDANIINNRIKEMKKIMGER